MYKINQLLYVIIVILPGKHYIISSFFFQIIAINSSYYFNALFSPHQIHICGDMPCMASAEKTFDEGTKGSQCQDSGLAKAVGHRNWGCPLKDATMYALLIWHKIKSVFKMISLLLIVRVLLGFFVIKINIYQNNYFQIR